MQPRKSVFEVICETQSPGNSRTRRTAMGDSIHSENRPANSAQRTADSEQRTANSGQRTALPKQILLDEPEHRLAHLRGEGGVGDAVPRFGIEQHAERLA